MSISTGSAGTIKIKGFLPIAWTPNALGAAYVLVHYHQKPLPLFYSRSK